MLPAMYDELWVGAKGMYKTEPAIADGGEVIIYAPHLHDVSVVHGHLIEPVGYHVRDYFLARWDEFKHLPWGALAHSTHLKGAGTYQGGVERPRIQVTLATGLSGRALPGPQPRLPRSALDRHRVSSPAARPRVCCWCARPANTSHRRAPPGTARGALSCDLLTAHVRRAPAPQRWRAGFGFDSPPGVEKNSISAIRAFWEVDGGVHEPDSGDRRRRPHGAELPPRPDPARLHRRQRQQRPRGAATVPGQRLRRHPVGPGDARHGRHRLPARAAPVRSRRARS